MNKVTGTIHVLNPGFGLIKETETNIHFLFTSDDFKDLLFARTGDPVKFDIYTNSYNKKKAINIELLSLKSEINTETIAADSTFLFKNKNDFNSFTKYSLKFINSLKENLRKFENPIEVEEKLNNYLKILENIGSAQIPNQENFTVQNIIDHNIGENIDIINELFSFSNLISDLEDINGDIKTDVKEAPNEFIWGGWRLEESREFFKGYENGYFKKSYIEKGVSEQITLYETPPPSTHWKIQKITQKGHVFFIGKAKVNQIAQSSCVPSLPPKMSIIETANRIIGYNDTATEWQREMDKERILKIENFIGQESNVIANAPMLYINNSDAVEITDETITIHFNKFLKYQKSGIHEGFYTDRIKESETDEFGNFTYQDFRPLWIIDGQHRLRGIHQNEQMQDIEIPIIIFPSDFNSTNTAKIFAEINTLQKKLDPLHELFMQHKFCIDHVNIKRKFINYLDTTFEDARLANIETDWLHSRANHLAYRIAARLAKNGALAGRIKFLPQNQDSPNLIVASADQWLNYARNIFYSKCYKFQKEGTVAFVSNPNEDEAKMTEEDVFFVEMNNYFNAIKTTCTKNWPAEYPRWIPTGKDKGLIQTKSHFIILLEIYYLVYRITKERNKRMSIDGIIQESQFEETLKPLQNVDWIDRELINQFGGGGEKGRRSLEAWIIDAIIHGKSYSVDEIMNDSVSGEYGKGILSDLASPKFSFQIEPLGYEHSEFQHVFIDNETNVKLTAYRPPNARFESTWVVVDSKGKILQTKNITVSKDQIGLPARFDFTVKKSYFQKAEFVEFRVTFKNQKSGREETLLRMSLNK
jgi:DGQHR domain-containing protein